MNTRIKNIRRNVLYIIALCLLCAFLLPSVVSVRAEDTKTVYSDVLEDLRKDESFKPESYPEKDSGEYSINVIQIAESTKRELFVYTYEPRRNSMPFDATSINISTAINDSLKYENYELELLSASDVFGKYLVKNFVVLSDALRYYDISTIYRKWDNDIDGGISGGDGSEKAYKVGCLYSATTFGGNVIYSRRETEIIEIHKKDRFDGFIRYSNGGLPWSHLQYCDSYFIAFKSDRKIDDLMEADVSWVSRSYHYLLIRSGGDVLSERTDLGDPVPEENTLKAQDEAQNDLTGCLFGRKRYWQRIEKAAEFTAKEDLTAEAKAALADKQWVLRFTEYRYEKDELKNDGPYGELSYKLDEIGTRVSDVTIFRLMFETDGVVYNLGVVSDKISPDGKPDNKFPNGCLGFDFSDLWKYLLLALGVIVALVLLIAFFPHIVSLVLWLIKLLVKLLIAVFKGLWLIISAPFRGIAALVRKRKDKK